MNACEHCKEKAEWRFKDGWGALACADWFTGVALAKWLWVIAGRLGGVVIDHAGDSPALVGWWWVVAGRNFDVVIPGVGPDCQTLPRHVNVTYLYQANFKQGRNHPQRRVQMSLFKRRGITYEQVESIDVFA
ncbi:MAG: hypothetical protein ABIU05_27020 [Nitrospirales bacterium]